MTATFDFDRSVAQAWDRFAVRLGEVLSMMDETEPLILLPDELAPGRWRMEFVQERRGRLMVRLTCDPQAEVCLSPAEVTQVLQLGWQPTADGFCFACDQDDSAQLARKSVAILRDVLVVEHPVFLDASLLAEMLRGTAPAVDSKAYDDGSGSIPSIGEDDLTAVVAQELSAAFGAVPIRDQDGDFAIRVGSTMIFVAVPVDGLEIRLFSVIVHDVAGRSRAMEVLNDVNAHARWVKFYLVRDKIFATLSILASPFVAEHLRQAITEMANVADGVDGLLAASLQGKTTFPEQGWTGEEPPSLPR
ncbi:MAG: YbjN domain-containing protein [Propionibacteriaceae bacterium]|jgi:hypothetical protein|nr:YbjN domain-containing protein [Propionibacteriaceae bacterium]